VINDTVATQQIADSGPRRDFNSGAVRDGEVGKGRYDLVSPIALELLAEHSEAGALKYDARNWEKGIPLSVYLDSAMRHINKYRAGQRDEPHMVSAMWNIMAFLHTREMIRRGGLPKELDNLPNYIIAINPKLNSSILCSVCGKTMQHNGHTFEGEIVNGGLQYQHSNTSECIANLQNTVANLEKANK